MLYAMQLQIELLELAIITNCTMLMLLLHMSYDIIAV